MKTLREQIKALAEEARAITESAKADGRDVLTDEEQAKIGEKLTAIGELQTKEQSAAKSADLLKQLDGLPAPQDDPLVKSKPDGTAKAAGRKSLGEHFVDSEQFKQLRERFPNGIPDGVAPHMEPVNVGSLWAPRAAYGSKGLVFVGDNVGAATADSTLPAVPPDFRGIVQPDFGPLTVRQLISSGTTVSETVEYVREVRTSRDLNADVVEEATALSGTSGTKPESGFAFKPVKATVETIAHWIPTTRKALSDVGQTRTLIDTFLTRGLDEAVEHQIVNGSGTDEFLGIANDPGTTAVAFDTDMLTTVRKAKTALWRLGITPNALLMSPEDDEAIDLLQDGNQRYYANGPFGVGPSSLWGLPRVVSTEVPEGTAYLGDFSSAVLYDREAATIMTGTVDKDFIRNIIRVLAEMRAAFAIWRPYAIAEVDVSA